MREHTHSLPVAMPGVEGELDGVDFSLGSLLRMLTPPTKSMVGVNSQVIATLLTFVFELWQLKMI